MLPELAAPLPIPEGTEIDHVLLSLARGVRAYFRHPGPQCAVDQLWERLFTSCDQITFEEFDAVVRLQLRSGITRYELRILWNHVDPDGVGTIPLYEISELMYRADLGTWPDIDDATLEACLCTMAAADEKWHRVGGNWFSIFRAVDGEPINNISYEDLRRCVRSGPPGLKLSQQDITDAELQGLWKRLNSEGTRVVTLQDFMTFMRRYGPAAVDKRLRLRSKNRVVQRRAQLGPVPHRSPAELRILTWNINQALRCYWASLGAHANTMCRGGHLSRYLLEACADRSGRLVWAEFSYALQYLDRWMEAPPTPEDLYALWAYVDLEDCGEVTGEEVVRAFFRLDMEDWPDPEPRLLNLVVEEMHAAVVRWHRAEGNWYKVFCLIDAENTGRVAFEAVFNFIRAPYPCLGIPADRVPDQVIRAFWKGLDQRGVGEASIQEFMLFMRRHGSQHSVSKLTQYSSRRRHLQAIADRRDVPTELAAVPPLTGERLREVSRRFAQCLSELLNVLGATSPGSRFSYLDFELACRTVARALPRQDVQAFWRVVDPDCGLELTARQFSRAVYGLKLDAWPQLDAAELARLVAALEAAADKWHRAGGNWFKVFAHFDSDGSGMLSFEDFVLVVRKGFPGLGVRTSAISDAELKGLWRVLDLDRVGKVSVSDFMRFMRSQSELSKTRPLALQGPGGAAATEGEEAEGAASLDRTPEQLQEVICSLDRALAAYWARRGVLPTVVGHWDRLFSEIGGQEADGGRLGFAALEQGLRERLQGSGGAGEPSSASMVFDGAVAKGVSRDDLRALWLAAEGADGSGLLTSEQWRLCLAQYTLASWPDLEEPEIRRVVDELNAAADKWHNAGGDWYRLLSCIDAEIVNSSQLSYDDLHAIVRRKPPCLAIPTARLSDAELKGFWKALDVDQCFYTTLRHFLHYVRHNGAKRGARRPSGTQRRPNASLPEPARRAVAEGPILEGLAPEQRLLLSAALGKHSAQSFAAAYRTWGKPWAGSISEFDLLPVVRALLGIPEVQISDDQVFAMWLSLKEDDGRIPVEDLLQLGQAA